MAKSEKKRLDLILYELGHFDSKNKAQANILAGNVKIGEIQVTKAGEMFYLEDFTRSENPLLIKLNIMPYVSRGGLKLEKALSSFKINLKDRLCIDIGASTGGFTDCMLQFGAKKVWAVDVGYNQLDWKLKTDERVVATEKTNVKNCTFEDIFGDYKGNLPSFLSMDLSFISVKKVLENVKNFISLDAELIILIKPQFEAKREEVQKGGVVKDEEIHKSIIKEIEFFVDTIGLKSQGVIVSPIQGSKSGNTEYLMHLRRVNDINCR